MGSRRVTRRHFLATSGTLAAVFTAAETTGLLFQRDAVGEEEGAGISPVEDLMREHGVLRRLLFVYENWIYRLTLQREEKTGSLFEAANTIRSFVEEYHEKLEEDYVFPIMKKAGQMADLVNTLLVQHQAGRRLTENVLTITGRGTVRDTAGRTALSNCLVQFIRMYRPHAAREDTVLFPAFRGVVEQDEYDRLGDLFEKKEDSLFGEKGFERVVGRVASIEKVLGIYDLAQFTPQ
jgi:hemerythrin-like domain-containing protein